MLIAVAVSAIPLGWVAYQLSWIRQRHAVLRRAKGYKEAIAETSAFYPTMTPFPTPKAPGLLWLFGEEGQYSVTFTFTSNAGYLPSGLADDEEIEVERAKLFFQKRRSNGAIIKTDQFSIGVRRAD